MSRAVLFSLTRIGHVVAGGGEQRGGVVLEVGRIDETTTRLHPVLVTAKSVDLALRLGLGIGLWIRDGVRDGVRAGAGAGAGLGSGARGGCRLIYCVTYRCGTSCEWAGHGPTRGRCWC